ncbi:hypothetical protein EI94DRAFT_1802863 [Lactarius quietus]|nr:hypothetical protein EI94DRAFT_1802863 [Lactarius quietus]
MGGHCKLSHEEMSLWEKHISEGKATKYLPPKTTKFKHPMTKKPKSGPAPPEVHFALNFTPTPSPGVGPSSYIIAGQQIVLSSMAPALGQSPPTDVSGNPVHTVNVPSILGTQSYSAPAPQPEPSIRTSRMRMILECRDVSAVPLVADLLTLMDQDHPTLGLNYVDTASEFNDLGVKDVLDVFAMPIELLASFGGLGRDQAHQLHKYFNSLDQGLDEYGWGEEGGWEEEEDWDERYNWGIGKEEKERVLEWLTGVREARENDEGESDGLHEV